jgi:hypothetical protein
MSNNFTIEDIHRLRCENYDATKELSKKELIEYTKKETSDIRKTLDDIKKQRAAI